MLRSRLGQLQRARVGSARRSVVAESPQQVRARRVVVAVVAELEVEAVEQRESGFGSLKLGDGDRAVHGHDRRTGDGLEPLVEEGDLLPVTWHLKVEICDRRLEEIGPARPCPAEGERALEQLSAFL